MSEHIAKCIAFLEQEIEAIDQRRSELVRADELLAVIREPWLSDDERRQALNRSLARLRMKERAIRHVEGDAKRWELVA